MLGILNGLLPLFYGAVVWSYGESFFRDTPRANAIKTTLLTATIGLHAAYLLARTFVFQHPPITTVFEVSSIIAFSLAIAYRTIELRTGIRNTGFFILSLALALQVLSSLWIEDLADVKPILRSNMLGVHVTSAMLGVSAFAISAVYGLLYLMLYHNIKRNRFGVVYEKLPSLETLERMAVTAVVVGFVLLTLAILVGIVWMLREVHEVTLFDPKPLGTLVLWVVYGVGLWGRKNFGWNGRRIMVFAISGFTISLLSLTVINMYFTGFHNFY